MSSRPAESLEQMIRRCIRDARAVGEPMPPERLAFAVNAAGWTTGRPRSRIAPPGTPSAALVKLVRDFTRNNDPEEHARDLARLLALSGYQHIRNPVFPTRQDA